MARVERTRIEPNARPHFTTYLSASQCETFDSLQPRGTTPVVEYSYFAVCLSQGKLDNRCSMTPKYYLPVWAPTMWTAAGSHDASSRLIVSISRVKDPKSNESISICDVRSFIELLSPSDWQFASITHLFITLTLATACLSHAVR